MNFFSKRGIRPRLINFARQSSVLAEFLNKLIRLHKKKKQLTHESPA